MGEIALQTRLLPIRRQEKRILNYYTLQNINADFERKLRKPDIWSLSFKYGCKRVIRFLASYIEYNAFSVCGRPYIDNLSHFVRFLCEVKCAYF